MSHRSLIMLTGLLFLCAGCVELDQEIQMNHDGSGKIVEKLALTPRSVRMLEAANRRAGQANIAPEVLSDAAFQERLKAMGEVTLEQRQDVTLPDGRKQIQATYAFKNIGKVHLYVVPTVAYKARSGSGDGMLSFSFAPQETTWNRLMKEVVHVALRRLDGEQKSPMSPADRQKYQRVLPIFLDLVQDLQAKIVLVAPKDIEDFGLDSRPVAGFPFDRNRVTIFQVDGRGVAQNPGGVLQLIMNEVGEVRAPNMVFNNGHIGFMKAESVSAK